jgi:hypothetical protein
MNTSWRLRLVPFVALLALCARPAPGQSIAGPQAPPVPAEGPPNGVVELDRNDDHVVDYRIYYDRSGMVSREEMDYDLDGAMDTFFFYSSGVLQREEIDSNGDGKADIWIYLIDGKYIQRYERDTDGDGKPDTVRVFGKE